MDTTTLLIIIVVVLVVAYLMSRNRGALGGNQYPRNSGTGPQQPTYDDPDYSSTGSIGGTGGAGTQPPVSHRRDVGSASGAAPSGGRTNDDPNYRSGGSIGGS